MNDNFHTAIGTYVNHACSDGKEYFQILVHDKPVSFGGVRLFANVGSAKSRLLEATTQALSQSAWTLKNLNDRYPIDENYKKSMTTITENYNHVSDAEAKVLAKKLRDEMLSSGVYKIVPVK